MLKRLKENIDGNKDDTNKYVEIVSKVNKKIGRPKKSWKEIDYALLGRLALIQCTDDEIIAMLDISSQTFYDRMKCVLI